MIGNIVEKSPFGRIVELPHKQIRIYSGEALNTLPVTDRGRLAATTSIALRRHVGFMRQFGESEIAESIAESRFVVSVYDNGEKAIFLATAQIWPVDKTCGEYEVGTVQKLPPENKVARGQPQITVFEAKELARAHSATNVVAMAGIENKPATDFFDGLRGVKLIGTRLSNYVSDSNGSFVPMNRYDITEATGRRKLSATFRI